MSMSIGWCGYGGMGRPMCQHLVSAGFKVSAMDTNPERVQLMAEDGIKPCQSISDLALNDVVVTMLWPDATFHSLMLAEGGLASEMRKTSIMIDMSTISPHISEEVAKVLDSRGIKYLRAPVSGAESVAIAGQLSVFASGPQDAFERCLPLFRTFSSKQKYLGNAEESRYMKLIINMMVSASTAVLGEALSFAERAGLDPQIAMDSINESIVGSVHYRTRTEAINKGDMKPSGKWFGMKDLNMAMSAAAAVGTAMPIMGVVQQQTQMVLSQWPGANTAVAMSYLMRRINPQRKE
jgi:3-hydroxyisobutyrate dehydrogenase-like beta-hydroxyacid dehydrogenase